MATSADSMVRDAIKAYHAGNPDEARNLLFKATELDETNEQAWLWLSAVVEDDQDKQTCLENVLTINPNNDKAKQGLRILRERTSSASASPGAAAVVPEEDDPFASVSFTQPAQGSDDSDSTFPFSTGTADEDDEDEELPTDVQWGAIETSSASASAPINEPGPGEYEAWISNLNIGGNEAEETFGDAIESSEDPAFNAAPFIGGDDLFGSDSPFQLDDSIFGLDDPAFDSSPESATLGSPFADIDESAASSPPPESPPPVPIKSPPMSPVSPVADSRPDPLMESFGLDDSDSAEFGFLDDSAFDDAGFASLEPQEYFAYIPKHIKATRLPGTNEHYPPLLILALVLLFGLNIVALLMVFSTLSAG